MYNTVGRISFSGRIKIIEGPVSDSNDFNFIQTDNSRNKNKIFNLNVK